MPGEKYPPVSPGGGEWERVSDAEAAVVFNQRTRGALQLPAQQGVREVIIHTHTMWVRGYLQRDIQDDNGVISNWRKVCFKGLCFHPSAEGIVWSSVCLQQLHDLLVNQLIFYIYWLKSKGPNVHCLNKHWRWFFREVQTGVSVLTCVFMKLSGCMKSMYVW